MFYLFKRLWKDGLGTLPRRQLIEGRASSGAFAADTEALDALRHTLPKAIRKAFGRSLHIRHLDSGSSNACDWEMTALLNPVYDVQRFGIDFVASPRHADMLLVTGGVTRNLEEAVRQTYDATPEPKLVVAVGDDACGLGLIGRTYAHYGGVDQVIPVHVYVPGAPPTPADILHGILQAVEQTRTGQRMKNIK